MRGRKRENWEMYEKNSLATIDEINKQLETAKEDGLSVKER